MTGASSKDLLGNEAGNEEVDVDVGLAGGSRILVGELGIDPVLDENVVACTR